MAAPSSSRFANLDDEEYELLLQDKDTVNTKKSTKTAVIIFRDYTYQIRARILIFTC